MEINKLGNMKTIQSTEIPVKMLKQRQDVLRSYTCYFRNVYADKSMCPSLY